MFQWANYRNQPAVTRNGGDYKGILQQICPEVKLWNVGKFAQEEWNHQGENKHQEFPWPTPIPGQYLGIGE